MGHEGWTDAGIARNPSCRCCRGSFLIQPCSGSLLINYAKRKDRLRVLRSVGDGMPVHVRIIPTSRVRTFPTFFPSGRFTVEAEGMKVRLDAGDDDFLHKKAQEPNIDLTHSSRLFPQKTRRSFGFQLWASITYQRPQLEHKPSLRCWRDKAQSLPTGPVENPSNQALGSPPSDSRPAEGCCTERTRRVGVQLDYDGDCVDGGFWRS